MRFTVALFTVTLLLTACHQPVEPHPTYAHPDAREGFLTLVAEAGEAETARLEREQAVVASHRRVIARASRQAERRTELEIEAAEEAARQQAAAEQAEREAAAAAAAAAKPPPPPARPAPSHAGPGVLARIAVCESGAGGEYIYRPHGPASTASGKYGFLDGTWAGYGGYARAYQAPEAVQDQAALALYNSSGTTPWNASRHCWGG